MTIDEQPAARVFVSAEQAALVAAQWRGVALEFASAAGTTPGGWSIACVTWRFPPIPR